MRRDARAAEDVGDEHVGGGRRGRLPARRGRRRRAAAMPAPSGSGRCSTTSVQQPAVGLDDVLPRARPGRGQIPGQRQRAAAEVQHVQRPPRLGDGVQDVPEPPRVLELQMRRLVQVDVRLRRPVDGEQPGPLPVHVGHQLGGPVIHGTGHGYRLVHRPLCLARVPRQGRGAVPILRLPPRGRDQPQPAPQPPHSHRDHPHTTAVTVPAPTVRPPSRMAKPSPGSSGTSRPSSTVIVTVSPGRATAISPRSTSPTTSAVRM